MDGSSDDLKGFYCFPYSQIGYHKPEGETSNFGEKVKANQRIGFVLDMDEGFIQYYLDGKPMANENKIQSDRLKNEKFNLNLVSYYGVS